MSVARHQGPAGRSFSASVEVDGPGSWIYVSGQLGTNEQGEIVEGGFEGESRSALENVLSVVRRAGGTAADVVKITAYLTSMDNYDRYNEVRGKVFSPTLPASTAIAVAGLLPDTATIEIDAVAFVPDGG